MGFINALMNAGAFMLSEAERSLPLYGLFSLFCLLCPGKMQPVCFRAGHRARDRGGQPLQSACGSTPIMAGMDQPRELEEVLAEGEVLAVPPAAEGSATGKSDDSKGKNWFVQVRPNHSIAIFVSCDAVTCLEALIW